MALLGSTERRLHSLKIAASMLRRMGTEDPVPTAEQLIVYAHKLSEFAYRGEKTNGDSVQSDGT